MTPLRMPSEYSLPGLISSVPAGLLGTARLVDVPEEAQKRLVLLDELLGAEAAGVDLLLRRHRQRLVQLGTQVE